MDDRPRPSPTTVPRHRPPYREGVTGDGGQIVSTVPRGTVGDGGGQSEDTPSPDGVGSTDAMIAERRAQREAATTRRRALRALQRQQFDEARQHGLRARHAAKEKP